MPGRSEFPRENRLIVQDNAEEGGVDLQAAVVINEPEVLELVHEEVDARSRRPARFSERFLGNLGYLIIAAQGEVFGAPEQTRDPRACEERLDVTITASN